jgi:hypothetical protein
VILIAALINIHHHLEALEEQIFKVVKVFGQYFVAGYILVYCLL